MRASCTCIALAYCALVTAGCSDRTLPPLGEAVVVVDTDLAVPRVVSRLRVDTYALDGTWVESRDIPRPDPRDWPASFSVQAPDDLAVRDVIVRIRVYGNRVRDAFGGPRLVAGGVDVTPPEEPLPNLTVDRLVRLRLQAGERGRVRVVAEAACAGQPARVSAGSFETCAGGARVPLVEPAPLEPTLETPSATAAGTAGRTPCPTARRDDVACVEGGSFVLGSDEVTVTPDPTLLSAPERVVRISTFFLDRHEVTVARFREALARGLVVPDVPLATEGPLGDTVDTTCSYSAAPRDREQYALTCVSWSTARAFCNFMGGDLPSEAQWEYAASSEGRPTKTIYPWGDEAPDCLRAVYGRLPLAGLPGLCELSSGRGPKPVFEGTGRREVAPGDATAKGVYGLAGGVGEWTRDARGAYGSACVASTLDPVCVDEAQPEHVVRGGSWASPLLPVRTVARLSSAKQLSFVGFRCAYGVAP